MNAPASLRLVGAPIRFAPGAGEPEAPIRLGMPQLSGCGLSENWLLKELGHRHWMMLADEAGMEGPDFRDEEGRPVYAAFCALRLRNARLDLGAENGSLALHSAIRRVSRTQVESRHELRIDGAAGGTVEMVSTFIKRTGRGNHAVARVSLDGLMPIVPQPSELAALAAAFRAGRRPHHLGIDMSQAPTEIAAFDFDPCPEQDFNGAGFLYFPSFLAFVDRAEWRLEGRRMASLRRREAYYYGNVDMGETLRIALVASRDGGLFRWWQVLREGTSTVLADVFTDRASS